MGSKIGLIELKTVNEDGTLLSRLQMEQQLRQETVYHRRLRAFKLGLPNKVVQHMLPISITHWLLDYWIQHGQITGEILGIRSEFDADDNKDYLRQLTQRLMLFVEHGLAVKPNPGEGIDMTQFTGMPPGFPPMPQPGPTNSIPQPSFAPPPMPGIPGMPGFQPSMPSAPMPPMPLQNFPPQQAAQPQFQQPVAPPLQQQIAVHSNGQPVKADPIRQWGQAGKREDGTQRTRRTKEEVSEDANYEAWCKAGGDPSVGSTAAPAPVQAQPQNMPPQTPAGLTHFSGPPNNYMSSPTPPTVAVPPNPFGVGGVPQGQLPMPNMPMPAAMMTAASPAASGGPLATEAQAAQIIRQNELISKGLAQVLRIMYSEQGEADLELVLTKVCKIDP